MSLRKQILPLIIATAVAISTPALVATSALADGPDSVSDLAARLSPAVVNVGTSRRITGSQGMPFPDLPQGSPLEDLFRDLNPNQGLGPELEREARSLGSGFIVSEEGLIVTNNHVIDGAEEILVFLADGTRLAAKVVGADDKTDLAVLKVDSERKLPFVKFGDSDDADVGDWVMAIGNPFGLGGSVTLGIVSARNRDINSGPYDNFIQTDASINQGNSGGPLFDMDGKVVGINTAIIAQGGSSLGIGFAVPVNVARPVIDQLTEYGETRRGWLGVGIQEVNEDIAASLGLESTDGAIVIDITAGGPSAGILQEGDLILKFDGKKVSRMRDLPRIVAETEIGKEVKLVVLRAGKEIELGVTLGRLEVGEALIAARQEERMPEEIAEPEIVGPAPGALELMGFDIAPLDEANRIEFGVPMEAQGVLVTKVTPGTDADDKGMTAGVVISEVNQQPIETVADVTSLIDTAMEAGRPAVLFKVLQPTGVSRFLAVKPK